MGDDLRVFHEFAVDLHSLAKNSCGWRYAQPPRSLIQRVGNLVADNRLVTPPRHLVLQNRLARHFLDGGNPLLNSTLLPRRICSCYCT